MKRNRALAALSLSLVALVAAQAGATTYVPTADAELADQAGLVVRARVVAVESGPLGEPPTTDYTVDIERVLSGYAPGTTLIVRVPGGSDGEGRRLHVWGAPRFVVGERALLLLRGRDDGAFGILHLMLGAFHQRREGQDLVLERDLAEAHALGGGEQEPLRLAHRFERWLEDRAAGIDRPADYVVQRAAASRAVAEFTYLNQPPARWFDFEQGRAVPWRAHEAGQQGLAGGGFAEFQQALAVWNGDAATNISYGYAGTTAAFAAFRRLDGVNAILFNDPHGDAEGTFSCPGGGVLAVAGPWFDDEAAPPFPILGADIVVNNGAECWFAGGAQGRLRAAEVFAHELGHTLGLGHSCGDDESGACDTAEKSDALMRATAKRVSAGAVLGADDRAAILSLYPGADDTDPGGGLAAPAGLTAAVTRTTIRLAWNDETIGESSFLIEMRQSPRLRFRQVAVVPRNKTVRVLRGLRPDTVYELRIRAKGAPREFSAFSETLTVRTLP